MKAVARITSASGVLEARSCAEAIIDAPANTVTDISIAMAGGMPLATIATPQISPKGATPSSTGSEARAPAAIAERSNRAKEARF
jgi:hypothetical protein